MNWRTFKKDSGDFKSVKYFKPPTEEETPHLKCLKDLSPHKQELVYIGEQPTNYQNFTQTEQALADEAERREDFCTMHRDMIGGTCTCYNVTNGFAPGDRTTALDGCLLWRLVKSGLRIELAGPAEVSPGTTIADVLLWIRHPGDIDLARKERRLLLTCAESMGLRIKTGKPQST